jgi:hypothetical protein
MKKIQEIVNLLKNLKGKTRVMGMKIVKDLDT